MPFNARATRYTSTATPTNTTRDYSERPPTPPPPIPPPPQQQPTTHPPTLPSPPPPPTTTTPTSPPQPARRRGRSRRISFLFRSRCSLYKFSLVGLLVVWPLNLLGLVLPYWMTAPGRLGVAVSHYGLWTLCAEGQGCEPVYDGESSSDVGVGGWLFAVALFAILSIIAHTLAAVCGALQNFLPRHISRGWTGFRKRVVHRDCEFLDDIGFVAGFLGMVPVIVTMVATRYEVSENGGAYSVSFALSFFANTVTLVASIAITKAHYLAAPRPRRSHQGIVHTAEDSGNSGAFPPGSSAEDLNGTTAGGGAGGAGGWGGAGWSSSPSPAVLGHSGGAFPGPSTSDDSEGLRGWLSVAGPSSRATASGGGGAYAMASTSSARHGGRLGGGGGGGGDSASVVLDMGDVASLGEQADTRSASLRVQHDCSSLQEKGNTEYWSRQPHGDEGEYRRGGGEDSECYSGRNGADDHVCAGSESLGLVSRESVHRQYSARADPDHHSDYPRERGDRSDYQRERGDHGEFQRERDDDSQRGGASHHPQRDHEYEREHSQNVVTFGQRALFNGHKPQSGYTPYGAACSDSILHQREERSGASLNERGRRRSDQQRPPPPPSLSDPSDRGGRSRDPPSRHSHERGETPDSGGVSAYWRGREDSSGRRPIEDAACLVQSEERRDAERKTRWHRRSSSRSRSRSRERRRSGTRSQHKDSRESVAAVTLPGSSAHSLRQDSGESVLSATLPSIPPDSSRQDSGRSVSAATTLPINSPQSTRQDSGQSGTASTLPNTPPPSVQQSDSSSFERSHAGSTTRDSKGKKEKNNENEVKKNAQDSMREVKYGEVDLKNMDKETKNTNLKVKEIEMKVKEKEVDVMKTVTGVIKRRDITTVSVSPVSASFSSRPSSGSNSKAAAVSPSSSIRPSKLVRSVELEDIPAAVSLRGNWDEGSRGTSGTVQHNTFDSETSLGEDGSYTTRL